MKDIFIPTRRDFIKKSAIISVSTILPFSPFANTFTVPEKSRGELKLYIFSKHLQFLNYIDMCEAAKEMGFDGIDLTVRRKGHVLPERVEEDLPLATSAMKSVGFYPLMISTNVGDAKNETDVKVLKTASQLGYQFYRPNWYKFKENEQVIDTFEYAKKKLKGLSKLNKKLGIAASYHNHSGHYFGSSIQNLYHAIEDLPFEHMGVQYDIMHATIEGAKNWEIGFKLIKPFINTLVIKDFAWEKKAGKWTTKYVPLGEGMVDFERYFHLLKANNLNAPMSLHVEYGLGGAEKGKKPTIPTKEVFKRIKKDVDFIRRQWER